MDTLHEKSLPPVVNRPPDPTGERQFKNAAFYYAQTLRLYTDGVLELDEVIDAAVWLATASRRRRVLARARGRKAAA